MKKRLLFMAAITPMMFIATALLTATQGFHVTALQAEVTLNRLDAARDHAQAIKKIEAKSRRVSSESPTDRQGETAVSNG